VVPNAVDANETEVVPVWGCLDIVLVSTSREEPVGSEVALLEVATSLLAL